MKMVKLRFWRSQDTQLKRWEPVPYRSKRRRSWQDPGVLIPIIISIVALAISGLSYWNQRQSSQAAATTQEQAEANLVSEYEDVQNNELLVANVGTTPVYAIEVVGELYSFLLNLHFRQLSELNVGELPPCSTVKFNISSSNLHPAFFPPSRDPYPKAIYLFDAQELVFQDNQQKVWVKDLINEQLKLATEAQTSGRFHNQTVQGVYSVTQVTPNKCQ